ncbi:hypothetical protein VTN96DRAFT_5552 [Rasamsonia emersonii]
MFNWSFLWSEKKMSTKSPSRPVRTRAKRACTTCHARRVRCNVVETQPCDNCRVSGARCEIGISRRGKYPRYIINPHPNGVTAQRSSEKGFETSSLASDVASRSVSGCDSLRSRETTIDQKDALPHESNHGGGVSNTAPVPSPACPHQVKGEMDRTVFFGESSPLTCVVDEGRKSPEAGVGGQLSKFRWQYPIPEVVCRRSGSFSLFASRRARRVEQLMREGAFDFPDPPVCEMLLQAYFEWFHPCFPIVDRVEISESCHKKTISPLLLQSMLFIGASLCRDEALRDAGFHDRYETKFLFYDRAKDIFDADCETDSLSKLQALFLLSFWRSTPSHEKDTRYWLGAAISLAQTGGMHMLSKLSLLSPKERRVRKRIWWSLYIRDQQVAAAFGLPARIRDEDCDIPMLEESDFEEEGPVGNPAIFGTPKVEHALYMIQMTRLARLLREVVWTAYLPGKLRAEQAERDRLRQRLMQWEAELPPELKLQDATERGTMYFAGMLHMAYNNLYILLYRPSYLDPSDELKRKEGKTALQAACQSTRIIEDMLSQNLVQHGLLHLITHIFSALCIHTIHFCRSEGTERKLAEHRAKLCLLGLKELQKSWDLNYWVLEIFFHCLDESTAEYLQLSEEKSPKRGSTPTKQSARSTQSIPDLSNGNSNSNSTPSSAELSTEHDVAGPGPQPCEEQSQPQPQHQQQIWSENGPQQPFTPSNNEIGDMPIDLCEPFLFEEEFVRNFGSCAPRLDSLNSLNLDFLYRFL